MITTCKFDKNADIEKVVPGLAISIDMALTTGIVKDTADTTPYNKMTSTEEIGSYLHDAIDIALEARRVGQAMSNYPTATEGETQSGEPV